MNFFLAFHASAGNRGILICRPRGLEACFAAPAGI